MAGAPREKVGQAGRPQGRSGGVPEVPRAYPLPPLVSFLRAAGVRLAREWPGTLPPSSRRGGPWAGAHRQPPWRELGGGSWCAVTRLSLCAPPTPAADLVFLCRLIYVRFLSIIRNAGSFVSHLDYLWHDMQMRRAMNIKDVSVCRGAVANELGDRPGLARAPPPPAARDLAASRTPVSPRRGQQGAVGPRGASLAPGAQLPGAGSPCSQCRPPSAPSLGAGRGRPSFSLRGRSRVASAGMGLPF